MREIHKDDIIHCVEYEPQCRTMHIGNRKYYLSLPYTQFTTISDRPRRGHKSFHATFSNKPLVSIKSPAFHPLLPNIYPFEEYFYHPCSPSFNCQVCLGQNFRRIGVGRDIFEMISDFWQAEFHGRGYGDPWIGPTLLRGMSLKSYLVWSEQTQKDTSFITKVEWPVKVKISDFPKLDYEDYCCIKTRKK